MSHDKSAITLMGTRNLKRRRTEINLLKGLMYLWIQIEKTVKTMWPEFEYIFPFDHICGHDRQRPDGLTTTGLNNKGFGGAQPKMRVTKIEEDDVHGIGIHAT
jgi:hypothetical protein